MVNAENIVEAITHLRTTNQTIPDEVIDFMKKASIEMLSKEERDKKMKENVAVGIDAILYTLGMGEEEMHPDEAERRLRKALETLTAVSLAL